MALQVKEEEAGRKSEQDEYERDPAILPIVDRV